MARTNIASWLKRKYEKPRATVYRMETCGMIASSGEILLNELSSDDETVDVSDETMDVGDALSRNVFTWGDE